MRVHGLIATGFALAVLFPPVIVRAQQTGEVAGTITDPSGRPLGGVTVQVGSSRLGAASERDGRYRVVRVPAGSQTLTFRYIGFQSTTRTIEVKAGDVVTLNVQLSEAITQLATVTVAGQVAGQAAALNQQKTSLGVSSVIDNELVGRLPDPNMAEALARVPGVAMVRDQGEGRFVQIRGTSADLNSLSVNGERVSTPEQSSRQVPMDIIPSDQAAAIQVSKTLTADMDADAIGGNVNIVTRRALPNQTTLSLTSAGGRNALGGGALVNLGFNAGKRFGPDQKFGAILGGTYYRNDRASQNFEGTWCSQDRDCGPAGSPSQSSLNAPRLWELRDYPQVDRLRQGLNGTLDYQVSDRSRLSLRGTWSRFSDDEIRYRTRYAFRAGGGSRWNLATADSGTTTGSRMDRDIRLREVIQDIANIQLTGEHTFRGGRELNWSVATSRSEEDRPDVRTMVFRQANMGFGYNFADEERPRVNVVTGAFDDPTRFAFNSFTREVRLTQDEDVSGRINFTWPTSLGGNPATFKVGAVARLKDRENRLTTTVHTSALTGSGIPTGAQLFSTLVGTAGPRSTFGGDYNIGRHADPALVADFIARNRGAFTVDPFNSRLASDGGSFTVGEDVYAGFAMAEIELGRLQLVPGLRVEATRVENTANRIQIQGTNLTSTPVTASASYTNIFPSINANWRANEFTNVRAAVTTSLVRPQFGDMVPYVQITAGQPTASIGNPDLKPTTALNYDLMIERYFRNVGFVSAGVFYKSLTDFIFATGRPRTADEQLGPDATQVIQPVNGPRGSLYGFELAWQQNLTFLPGLLSGLGLNANYTFTTSDATIPRRGDEEFPLPGQTGNAGNLGLFYDRGRLSLRVGANYSGEFLSTINAFSAEGDTRTRERLQVDASGSLRITNQIRFFGEFINLTNTPLRATVGNTLNRGGGGDDPSYEFYRSWGMIGIRIER